MARDDKASVAGCLFVVLSLFITLPMFYAVMIGLLIASDAPTWTWVVFWCYMPVSFVLGMFRAVIDELGK